MANKTEAELRGIKPKEIKFNKQITRKLKTEYSIQQKKHNKNDSYFNSPKILRS